MMRTTARGWSGAPSVAAAARRIGALAAGVVLFGGTVAWHTPPEGTGSTGGKGDPQRLFRLDGKFVHNVGRLQLQITNLGETGNQNNPSRTTVPSAEWPAGSGNDYLYAAGLWVGAIDASGIPHVTTALYQREFSPQVDFSSGPAPCANLPLDQIADVRESYEGIPGGNRVISASVDPDDDGDGLVDEDFPNGLDDDGDGLCDEDYAAVGQQMFATEYFDDIPAIRQFLPEHVPLGIRVRQTSYAWATPGQNDFVGMDYQITNRSGRTLRNVMVAIFADPDIGNRGIQGYFQDDQVGLFDRQVTYVGSTGQTVKRRIQMAYAYDNPDNPNNPQEAKGGDAPGWFGCMFLNHTVDPSGQTAPNHVGVTSFKFFSGSGSFIQGGDPENDAQRYQLMTDPQLNPDVTGQQQSSRPLDYRFIMATGPFRTLLPDSTLTISVGWVMGLGFGLPDGAAPPPSILNASDMIGGSLIANAVSAQQVFDGLYTDLDGRLSTGTCGKETCLNSPQSILFQYPPGNVWPDSSCIIRFRPEPSTDPRFANVDYFNPTSDCVTGGGRFWCIDNDLDPNIGHCASGDTTQLRISSPACVYIDQDCDVNTGQGGREHLVHWVAASPLPAPFFSGVDGRDEPRDFLGAYDTKAESTRVSAWFFPGDRKVTLKWNNYGELVRDAQRGNLKEFIGYRIYKASGWNRPFGTNAPGKNLWSLLGEWRLDPTGTAAHPLSELIDPSVGFTRIDSVRVSWDPILKRVTTTTRIEVDTLFAVGRYSFVDTHVLNGFPYFYSIVPVSVVPGNAQVADITLVGNPSATNAQVVYPRSDAQNDQKHVYVVPNPYKAQTEWDLVPREEDPSGTKVTFHNLPRTKGTIHIFTLAGDLVRDLPFDATAPPDLQYGKNPVTAGQGEVSWNLISRNGQKIVSGIYLFSVDTDLGREVGKFVIIR
ncbi:MAG TPA: hypothetical protein VFM00_05550 [Candidatus Eisenbacteria bacterium]|nr:hypothetical protein [Candidatus Eisenbacteria bacterium]